MRLEPAMLPVRLIGGPFDGVVWPADRGVLVPGHEWLHGQYGLDRCGYALLGPVTDGSWIAVAVAP